MTKKKPEKIQVSVRITEEMRDQLNIIADKFGRSANSEITLLIRKHIEQTRKDHPEIQLDLLTK